MSKRFNKKTMFAQNVACVLCCALFFIKNPSFAIQAPDFSCISTSSSTTKLINPLYLDTNKIVKPSLKINTMMEYSGVFDESDYFSSTIEDTPTITTPVDSASQNIQNVKKEAEIVETETKFTPTQNDYFSPPPTIEIKEQVTTDDKLVDDSSLKELDDKKVDDYEPKPESYASVENETDTYQASADITENHLDIEGNLVAKIDIQGLKTIQPAQVLSVIKTQIGSLFNSSILQQDLQNIYALGFFTDNMSIDPVLNPNGTIELYFTLEENILVSDILFSGNSVISAQELLPFAEFMKNKPQNINSINQAIDRINQYYHEKGYILAQVSSVDDDRDGRLILGITEGIINKISIEGNEKTKDYVIERNIMTQVGSVYNENYLKEDLSRVFSTQIFDDVERKIEPSSDKDGEYDVKVVVKEQSTNSIGLGGGIDNALGAFGSISFKEDNFLGRGQQVALSGILGSGILLSDSSIKNRMNYQLELSFFEPYFINADNSLASKLYYRDLGSYQIPLAIEQRIGFNTVVEHKVKGHQNLSTTLGAGIENINLKEGDFSKISSLYAANNLDISNRSKQLADGLFFNLAPGIKYSTVDSEENPRNGYIAQAKFIESFGLSEFEHTNGRLAGGVTKYYPVKTKSSLSVTARAGARVHGDDMPEIMAFRLGGPYSVRGFKMNGVGTGDAFLMGSIELATPLPLVDRFKFDILKKMRLTFFLDAGHIFDPTISSTLYDRPLSAISAGIGLKVFVPGVGPISVDYGLPLTNTGRYGSSGGYFTFGTGGMSGYGW